LNWSEEMSFGTYPLHPSFDEHAGK